MSEEDAEKKLKALTSAELVCDASMVFMNVVTDFFTERINNFGLLMQIAEEKRKSMEWPLPYKEHTAFVHSVAASLDVIDVAAVELVGCCDVLRSVLEDDVRGEKAYAMINDAMNKSLENITKAVQDKIDFVHGLGEDNDE